MPLAGMNVFRLCGDMLHLTSILFLLYKLHKTKNCAGVSCRMQEIYAIVFICRYMDLCWLFISVYNTIMKAIFITSTLYLVNIMWYKPPVATTYDRSHDSFRYEVYLLGPCLLLGVLCSEDFSPPEVLWTTSIWLESVAIVPQLVLLQKVREVENLTSHYVAAMGFYRLFYIFSWIYRYQYDNHVNWVGWLGGLLQTVLYGDFFYYYTKSKWYGSRLVLPTVA